MVDLLLDLVETVHRSLKLGTRHMVLARKLVVVGTVEAEHGTMEGSVR